ncbi:MAG: hypothetical protein BWX88_05112 [Planctomycetes bacterium ADurb.Bin126]|nr:MAG: hypothetical protein BWX88_05112 [Planctomycetes bacterium ADurb.Bin126]HOD83732.1 hypothetical protein [Phycisphaerae bacterium]
MPIRAGTIDADHLPEPGSIYSLTIRRGAEDPRTGVKTTTPLCFRLVVVSASAAGSLVLRAPGGPELTVTVEQFNERIAPHVVAAYGPPPEAAKP